MRKKDLRTDDEGLIPLLVGLGIASVLGWLGLEYLGMGDELLNFLRGIVIGCLLFVFGLAALWGKLVVIPRPWGFIIGVLAIVGSIYIIWVGV